MNVVKGILSRWQVASPTANPEGIAGLGVSCEQDSSLKPILLLTSLLFLLAAPAPDARDIADMSANFLIAENHQGLMASETPTKTVEEDIQK
jgi:hypothetical protein